jgi:hypothetical protein
MTEHNLPDKDDAPWLDCMDGFKTDDWVKRAAQESRAKIALEIFRAFDISACERGICDGPVLAAAFREAINQLQESPGVIRCSRLLYIAKALEEFDHTI